MSGLGNSLIILTINQAVISSQEMKTGLLMYFLLGLVLYIYGQKILRVILVNYTAEIVYSKRMNIINELLYTSYSQFEKIEQGVIQSTLNSDTETVSRFVNISISGLTSAITLVICFIYLGFLNFNALILSVIIILLISIIYYFTGQYANKIGEQSRNLQNTFYKFIDDLIGGYKELSLNKKKKVEFKDDLEISCNEYKKKKTDSELAFSKMFIIGELLFTMAIFSIVFIFPHLLKSLEYDSLSSYVFILLYMTGPVHSILNAIPSIIEVRISIKRINNLQASVQITNNNNQKKSFTYKENNILELKGVEYIYDDFIENERNFKIGPISFEFQSGEIIFIIGGNGSGKSTLAKILTGLYAPQKGSIELNGKEIQASNLSELYTTVFSDFYLFDKLYGTKYDINEGLIKKYLEILQLDKKVKIKNGMFSTTKLSAGQRKRLALLIAYLEDKPIYLFDEWAADQDPEFRKFFYNVLIVELKQRGKCVIAITHDDDYYYIADKVLKMNYPKDKNESYVLD